MIWIRWLGKGGSTGNKGLEGTFVHVVDCSPAKSIHIFYRRWIDVERTSQNALYFNVLQLKVKFPFQESLTCKILMKNLRVNLQKELT